MLRRREVVPIVHPTLGTVEGLYATGMPFVMSGSKIDLESPAPALGENNTSILMGFLGYSADRVEQLRRDGVV